MINKKKIFIAVDTNRISKANKIIKETQTKKIKIGYKFGLEFFYSKDGRKFLSSLKNQIIFLDLKLNDIPNTIKSALRSLKDLKISYLTVHLSSGINALKALKKESKNIKIAGVTTLTSLNNKDLKEIGYNKKVNELVKHQVKLAKKAKLDAIVCSGHEIRLVKRVFKKEIITPGIKINNTKNDQKRVMKPKDAFAAGSDWLVIGRSITNGNIKKNIQNLLEILED
jgi:orotidine-5'-phosphate decarboxylase|tara:strand:- start:301 stop:978 length:678 start_codon:yes stop_codon:yes gene_type:complete